MYSAPTSYLHRHAVMHLCLPVRRAFTILEVTVVAALLGIVMVLAAPSLLSSQNTANDQRAKGTIAGVVQAEVSILNRDGAFTADAATLDQADPNTTHVVDPTTSSAPDTASVSYVTPYVYVAVRSASGSCWLARVHAGTGNDRILYAVHDDVAACVASLATSLSLDSSQPGVGISPSRPIVIGS